MRVLTYLSTPDAQAEDALRSFLEERNAPRKPSLLFVAPGISPNQLQQLGLPSGSASDAH